jgi:hypothetical protein
MYASLSYPSLGHLVCDLKIIYTYHARQRMKQRNISEAEVVETLENPDDIFPGDEREDIAVKQLGTREIRVVCEETGHGTMLIYTVMRRKSQV